MVYVFPADYKFDLAVTLGRLELALELAAESDSESKWRQLGEMAMQAGRLEVRAGEGPFTPALLLLPGWLAGWLAHGELLLGLLCASAAGPHAAPCRWLRKVLCPGEHVPHGNLCRPSLCGPQVAESCFAAAHIPTMSWHP